MKKIFVVLFVMAALLPADSKPIQFTLGNWLWKPASDQALLTTSSPTFAGLTLSGGTASTLAYLNGSKAFTSLANSAGYLLNDGSGGLSWGAVSFAGYLKADGTVPLTADWNVGAFNITAKNLSASATTSAELITFNATFGSGAGWSWSTDKWVHAAGGGTTALTSTWTPTVGVTYKIVMSFTDSGTGDCYFGGMGMGTYGYTINSTQTDFTFYYKATSTAAIIFTPSNTNWTGSIDAMSVMAVTDGEIDAEILTLNSGNIYLPIGNATYPSLSFNFDQDTGLYYDLYFSQLAIAYNGTKIANFSGTGLQLTSNTYYYAIGGGSTGAYYKGGSGENIISSYNNRAQFGEDAAAPADQTIKACDGSGTDKAGAMLTLAGGQSTGTGTSGSLKLQTAYVAGTGSTANTYYTRQYLDGKVHTLVNNTATDMFSIACSDGNGVGGYINYTVEVSDGTDIQIESGTFTFAGVNKATETWTVDADKGTFSQALSGSSLTVTWATDTATADTLKVTVNSNSGLTPTSTKVQFQIFLNSPKVITIL